MRTRVLLTLVLCAVACKHPEAEPPVTVVTTPDVAATGIVSMLTKRFGQESKAPVKIIVTEERFVEDLARRRVADVVMTTSPDLKQRLERSGAVTLAETVAYDDYLLVGPRNDPAHAKGSKNGPEALRRIARRDRAFCSPVDVPELREREAILWNASPADPSDNRRYRTCRGSAREVLAQASLLGAYTLTDRSTLTAAGRDVKLVPLLEGTPLLHNDLTIVLLRQPPRNAEWLTQWVMSYRGRELIERYRYADEQRFFVEEK